MIKLCANKYDLENIFYQNYELSDFQKYSIHAINNGYHSLITAGTGSGKTLPAEYAIKYFHQKGLKTIYTSPIKALSNQKLYDFKRKFKDISFGLITGDIKCGPNADCVIMTCEILRNNLFKMCATRSNKIEMYDEFEMDLSKIGMIIFDEIHYINDKERGTVWEETLIALSSMNIQFLMLSATLDNPEKLASWISTISGRDTWISGQAKRVVPLEHYYLLFISDKDSKKIIKDGGAMYEDLVVNGNKFLLKDSEKFYDESFKKINIISNACSHLDIRTNKIFIINEVAKYIKQKNLMPSIFFSLSKKNVMKYASYITSSLNDEKLSNVVRNDANYIMSKLPNYKEYVNLPEYETLLNLFEKGLGYHHSGLLSIFRELTELMFEKGHIKLLFATETFAVGINLPTKAVFFDSLTKFDGTSSLRNLRSHEYTQMAGRAGRRSIDTIGYVFHVCCNVEQTTTEYKEILSNKSQKVESKFNICEGLFLRSMLFDEGHFKFNKEHMKDIIKKSSYYFDLMTQKEILQKEINNICLEDIDIGTRYEEIIKDLTKKLSQSKKKALQSELKLISCGTKFKNYLKYVDMKNELKSYDNLIEILCETQCNKLINNGLMTKTYELTKKGIVATNIQEVDAIILSNFLQETSNFDLCDEYEIVVILASLIESEDETCKISIPISKNIDYYLNILSNILSNSKEKIELNYYLSSQIHKWCASNTEEQCKIIINECDIYIGTFVKNILKINNLVQELISVFKDDNDIKFTNKLSKIQNILLKFIATNQCLYVG